MTRMRCQEEQKLGLDMEDSHGGANYAKRRCCVGDESGGPSLEFSTGITGVLRCFQAAIAFGYRAGRSCIRDFIVMNTMLRGLSRQISSPSRRGGRVDLSRCILAILMNIWLPVKYNRRQCKFFRFGIYSRLNCISPKVKNPIVAFALEPSLDIQSRGVVLRPQSKGAHRGHDDPSSAILQGLRFHHTTSKSTAGTEGQLPITLRLTRTVDLT